MFFTTFVRGTDFFLCMLLPPLHHGNSGRNVCNMLPVHLHYMNKTVTHSWKHCSTVLLWNCDCWIFTCFVLYGLMLTKETNTFFYLYYLLFRFILFFCISKIKVKSVKHERFNFTETEIHGILVFLNSHFAKYWHKTHPWERFAFLVTISAR